MEPRSLLSEAGVLSHGRSNVGRFPRFNAQVQRSVAERKRGKAQRPGSLRDRASLNPLSDRLGGGEGAAAAWHDAEAVRLRKKLSPFVAKLTDGYEMRRGMW